MAMAVVGPAEAFLTMAGRQKLCVVLYALALTSNLVLNVTLIPLFGLTGAAFATAGAMVAEDRMTPPGRIAVETKNDRRDG